MLGNKSIFSVFILTVILFGCQTKQLFEQSTIFPDHKWPSKQVNEYQFQINDSTVPYQVYFVIRHHNAYHYKNIWVQLKTTAPNDSVDKQSVNLNLADDIKGWFGAGMGDLYDQRIPIYSEPVYFKKGMYKFALSHTMREDPLENILSTGIRVEKVK